MEQALDTRGGLKHQQTLRESHNRHLLVQKFRAIAGAHAAISFLLGCVC